MHDSKNKKKWYSSAIELSQVLFNSPLQNKKEITKTFNTMLHLKMYTFPQNFKEGAIKIKH